MSNLKRLGALLLILVMMGSLMPVMSLAEETVVGQSVHGTFAVRLGDTVYAALNTGSMFGLYSAPASAGAGEDGEAVEFKLLDTANELGELVVANDSVYYLRSKDGQQQLMRADESGVVSVVTDFEADVVADHLSWYFDVLYCLANGRLFIVDPDSGESEALCDEPIDDYVIVNNVIFYISGAETLTYERTVNGQEQPLKQAGGTLWSLSILGTNPERLLQKGVTDLRAVGNQLYFHNLEDNYVMGSAEEMWLEGKLYRYNIETAQMASMNLDYDWDYYPTEQGVVVYTSQDVSLYPQTGGEKTTLMTPELRATMTVAGDTAFVYEASGKLTLISLDSLEQIVLDDGVLPSIEPPSTNEDDTVVVDQSGEEGSEVTDEDAEDIDDETYDDEKETTSSGTSSSYIFPNSSKKKLTRSQVLAIKKSLWGYARNEIWARHGYVFQKSTYKSYFSKKTWYKPGGFSTGSLNSIEWYNMELIKALEVEYGLLDGAGSGSSSSSSSASNNSYILKEASSKKLSKKYLRNKLGSKSKYALARNEILARHGYVFKTAKYKKYFGNQKWYKPGGYSDGRLSKTEWYNIEQLKDLENE